MIEKTGWGDFEEFRLICDHHEEPADEVFDTFEDAVRYKKENGWTSIKSDSGDWYEICPGCSTDEIIEEYRRK